MFQNGQVHTSKVLQQMLQSVSEHFGTLCFKELNFNLSMLKPQVLSCPKNINSFITSVASRPKMIAVNALRNIPKKWSREDFFYKFLH